MVRRKHTGLPDWHDVEKKAKQAGSIECTRRRFRARVGLFTRDIGRAYPH